MIEQIKNVWKRSPGRLLCHPSLFFVDNFHEHLIENVKHLLKEAKTWYGFYSLCSGRFNLHATTTEHINQQASQKNMKNIYAVQGSIKCMCKGEYTIILSRRIKWPPTELMASWFCNLGTCITKNSEESFKKIASQMLRIDLKMI